MTGQMINNILLVLACSVCYHCSRIFAIVIYGRFAPRTLYVITVIVMLYCMLLLLILLLLLCYSEDLVLPVVAEEGVELGPV